MQEPTASDRVPPLDGVRVLDLSGPIGAYCTRVLADLGADVVLVEPPEGDPLRRQPPFRDDDPQASLVFAYYHASKRSVVADLGDEERLAELGRGADVVVVSPTGATTPAGWDPASQTLSWAPDAVVYAITPFGVTGPMRRWRATPMVNYAMGGGMIRIGPPEGPPVTLPGRQQWDDTGLHGAMAVLAALHVLDTVGPQSIDLSAHEVATMKDFWLETYDVIGTGRTIAGSGNAARAVGIGVPPTGTYECADGPFDVAAHQVRHWDSFLEMLGHPPELADPALADPLVRRDRFQEVRATIEALVKDRSRQELVERGQAAGLPCGLLNRPTEFASDVQLRERGAIVPVPTPNGEVLMPGPGYRTVPALTRPRTSAPAAPGTGTTGWEPGPSAVPRRDRSSAGGQAAPVPDGPLAGLRVLTFGLFVAGNTTGNLLADLGADVVRIESLGKPEVLRTPAYAIGPTITEPSGATNTVMQASLSRSMRNLSIDVTTDAGREVFRRLVPHADVVVENFGASAATKLGLEFESLQELNPRIVLTSLSGFGRTGPRAGYLAYASNISNFVGLTYLNDYCHGTHSDYMTAHHAVVATLAALRSVAATGRGVRVDVAQIEAMAATMPEFLLDAIVNGRDVAPPGNDVAGSLLSGAYRCLGHDAWLAVEVQSLDDWARLGALLDLPLEAGSAEEAKELAPVLDAALVGWAADKTAPSAARELQRIGVAAGPVLGVEGIWHDPQLWSRGSVVELDQADFGPVHYAQSPHRLSVTPGRGRWAGARVGEHTTQVLHDWLGVDEPEIEAMLESGAAFQA